MNLKYKLYNLNNLVITLLTILLLFMLYLGNYNLIEGNMNNVTSSQVLSDLDLLLSKNTDNVKVLTSNIPYSNDCSSMENINDDYLKSVKEVGGAQALGAESIRNASQAKATACSTTVATNKL
jgi:hypothetical protein